MATHRKVAVVGAGPGVANDQPEIARLAEAGGASYDDVRVFGGGVDPAEVGRFIVGTPATQEEIRTSGQNSLLLVGPAVDDGHRGKLSQIAAGISAEIREWSGEGGMRGISAEVEQWATGSVKAPMESTSVQQHPSQHQRSERERLQVIHGGKGSTVDDESELLSVEELEREAQQRSEGETSHAYRQERLVSGGATLPDSAPAQSPSEPPLPGKADNASQEDGSAASDSAEPPMPWDSQEEPEPTQVVGPSQYPQEEGERTQRVDPGLLGSGQDADRTRSLRPDQVRGEATTPRNPVEPQRQAPPPPPPPVPSTPPPPPGWQGQHPRQPQHPGEARRRMPPPPRPGQQEGQPQRVVGSPDHHQPPGGRPHGPPPAQRPQSPQQQYQAPPPAGPQQEEIPPYMQRLAPEARHEQLHQVNAMREYGKVNRSPVSSGSAQITYFTGSGGGVGKSTTCFTAASVTALAQRRIAREHGTAEVPTFYVETDYKNPKVEARLNDPQGRNIGRIVTAMYNESQVGTGGHGKVTGEMVKQMIQDNTIKMEDTGLNVLVCPYNLEYYTDRQTGRSYLPQFLPKILRHIASTGGKVFIDSGTITTGGYEPMDREVASMAHQVVVVTQPGSLDEHDPLADCKRACWILERNQGRKRSEITVLFNRSKPEVHARLAEHLAPWRAVGSLQYIPDMPSWIGAAPPHVGQAVSERMGRFLAESGQPELARFYGNSDPEPRQPLLSRLLRRFKSK